VYEVTELNIERRYERLDNREWRGSVKPVNASASITGVRTRHGTHI